MILYLTITSGYDDAQSLPSKSLGGYKSANFVDNDNFGIFFGDLTQYTISKNRDEYIGLILKNTTGSEVTVAKIWTVTPPDPAVPYSQIDLGVQLVLTSDGTNSFMEYVQTINSKPLQTTIDQAEGEGNAVSIGTMTAGQEVGIWLRRSLLLSIISADQDDIVEKITPSDEHSLYQEKDKATEDTVQVMISYT